MSVVKVEVPVLVDTTGQAWAFPACREVTGAGLVPGSLIEGPALDAASAEVAAQAARADAATRGPGRHDVALAITQDPAPAAALDQESPARLGGWALAEELLAADLTDLGDAQPPASSGHAIEAHLLAADAPEGAPMLHVRLPQGPGIRIVECAEVGAAVGSSVALRIVAHGRDRATALARMRHALSDCALVVANSASNRSELLAAVSAEMGDAPARVRPESDPLAVLVSAVRASDSQRETARAAFHARAERGRPEPVDASGVTTSLDYHGQQYALKVFQTGPHTYRVDSGDAVAEVAIDRANDYEWTVTAAGRERHVVIASHGTGCLLEIDGIAHRVDRDEGIAVRAQWPALIVSVTVSPGQEVAEGDPIVVAEAMKMESTLRAPFAGTITAVAVLPNEQVDAGAPLVLIRPATRGDVEAPVQPTNGSRVSFAGMALADTSGRPPFERVYAALRGYLLGYELDPRPCRPSWPSSARSPTAPVPGTPSCLPPRTASSTCSPTSACSGSPSARAAPSPTSASPPPASTSWVTSSGWTRTVSGCPCRCVDACPRSSPGTA